jgi:hypothetical protein
MRSLGKRRQGDVRQELRLELGGRIVGVLTMVYCVLCG